MQHRDMSKLAYIVIHCSESDRMSTTIEDITQWHIARGWETCGYNDVIEGDGTLRVGRPDEIVGAHAEGFNSVSLGICLTGAFDTDAISMDDPQVRTLVQALAVKCQRYHIPPDRIIGHRDVYPLQGKPVAKTCPGQNLYDLLPAIREEVEGYLR